MFVGTEKLSRKHRIACFGRIFWFFVQIVVDSLNFLRFFVRNSSKIQDFIKIFQLYINFSGKSEENPLKEVLRLRPFIT